MSNTTTIISNIVFALSLTLVAGVFVHDTKLDKATETALAAPLLTANFAQSEKAAAKLTSDVHTHAERASVSAGEARTGMPRAQPRNDSRKYQLQKKVSRGVHAFDGYYYAFS